MPRFRLFLRALPLFLTLVPGARAESQWVAQASPTTAELRGLSVVSARVAWASGQHGTVLRTVDGGTTWRADTVPGASALDFRAIAAVSPTTAHVLSIGDSSRIYRTTDGGRTWTLRFTSGRPGSFFDAIQFWDARHGIAMSDPVGGRFLVITTSDGGATWQEVPAAGLPPALPGEGAFAASGTCLFVRGSRDAWLVSGGAASARVYHSRDRGHTWTVSDTPIRAGVSSAGIFSVAFSTAVDGVIAGGDYQQPKLRGRNVATTHDGGRTWAVADSLLSPSGYRSAVAYWPGSAGQRLVAVGLTGTDTSRDGGRSWSATDSVAYNSVALVADGRRCVRGWAVGPAGRIGTVRACDPPAGH
jgi:photosystem II stability/assembly factor-like uncharacterized protein